MRQVWEWLEWSIPTDGYNIYGAIIAKAFDASGFSEKSISINDVAVNFQKEVSKDMFYSLELLQVFL